MRDPPPGSPTVAVGSPKRKSPVQTPGPRVQRLRVSDAGLDLEMLKGNLILCTERGPFFCSGVKLVHTEISHGNSRTWGAELLVIPSLALSLRVVATSSSLANLATTATRRKAKRCGSVPGSFARFRGPVWRKAAIRTTTCDSEPQVGILGDLN